MDCLHLTLSAEHQLSRPHREPMGTLLYLGCLNGHSTVLEGQRRNSAGGRGPEPHTDCEGPDSQARATTAPTELPMLPAATVLWLDIKVSGTEVCFRITDGGPAHSHT